MPAMENFHNIATLKMVLLMANNRFYILHFINPLVRMYNCLTIVSLRWFLHTCWQRFGLCWWKVLLISIFLNHRAALIYHWCCISSAWCFGIFPLCNKSCSSLPSLILNVCICPSIFSHNTSKAVEGANAFQSFLLDGSSLVLMCTCLCWWWGLSWLKFLQGFCQTHTLFLL